MTMNRFITTVIQLMLLGAVLPMVRYVWLDMKENLIPEIKQDLRLKTGEKK